MCERAAGLSFELHSDFALGARRDSHTDTVVACDAIHEFDGRPIAMLSAGDGEKYAARRRDRHTGPSWLALGAPSNGFGFCGTGWTGYRLGVLASTPVAAASGC